MSGPESGPGPEAGARADRKGRGPAPDGRGDASGPPETEEGARLPREAAVAGLGPLLRVCVLVVGAALLAAVVPWSGAGTAARAGVGVLLSTPYLATLSAAVHYVRERRWTEAGLALLLLTLLIVGLWLGTGRMP